MRQNEDDNGKPENKQAFRYFVLTFVFLIAGGFFSGADGSFFLMGAAAAFFCLFMGIRSLPWKNITSSSRGASRPSSRHSQAPDTSKGSGIENFIEVMNSIKDKGNASGGKPKDRRGCIFAGLFIGFIVLFFAIVFFSVDSDDEDVTSAAEFVARTGDDFYNAGNYDSAVIYYRQALAFDPQSQIAYAGIGNVKLELKDYDSSKFYFNRALALDPDYELAHNGKALCYFFKMQYDSSIAESREVLAYNPEYRDSWLMIGDCFYAQEIYDSSIVYYEPGYSRGARSSLLCHRMAYMYDKQGQFDKAIPMYEEALTYDTTLVEIYKRLAEITNGEKQTYYQKRLQQY